MPKAQENIKSMKQEKDSAKEVNVPKVTSLAAAFSHNLGNQIESYIQKIISALSLKFFVK